MADIPSVPLSVTNNVTSPDYDGVLLVTPCVKTLPGALSVLSDTIEQYLQLDNDCGKEVTLLSCSGLPSKRLVLSPTGPVNRDQDDVRRFQEAAVKGIKRLLKAGSKRPLLVVPEHKDYKEAAHVAALGALHALYVPLEIRESVAARAKKAEKLGVWMADEKQGQAVIKILQAVETGRVVARDIGGSDPERMAAPRVAQYVVDAFKDTCVKVSVIDDKATFEKEYPLLSAVNRSAGLVDRHKGRVIFLEYTGSGNIDNTVMLVGKGITYDTGGADIKAGGVMAGMHRDKCGAAAVAGFFKTLSLYKPKGLKVVGVMCMVRNSVGSECYVSDEIITSRAGVRVRVGNTDAEGRMVMADLLCHMKEKALKEVNPHLFTVATLTGHVIRAFGPNYTGIMDNGPARKVQTAQRFQQAGHDAGEPAEVSTIRPEDYVAHTGPSEYEDVLQANNKPSTLTDRGHQNPSAFLIMASGLDKHGLDSDQPIKYSHVDVAGSSGPYPGIPTGAPVVAFSHLFVLNRDSDA